MLLCFYFIEGKAEKLWKNLKDTYRREKKNKQEEERTGAEKKNKKKWVHWDAMHALMVVSSEFRRTVSNLEVEEEGEETEEAAGPSGLAGSLDPSVHNMDPETAQESVAVAPRRRGKAKMKAVEETYLQEYLLRKEARAEQREREREKEKDEVTLFLLSLAPAMRRLPPERQSWLKFKMQGLVHEAEFGPAYSQPQP
ncbi:uncharacterized protein LOC115797015 [Xyrichtys novacula]|uniref:Uncharacterized protein LOC115797015 n=1 Tax=Xyrichtys novacula TaxID=13765 RepID=A0AAV1EPZ5_XYRNO|nr:uncharacterized protein LOC115797015 [Xyrichtys novacula]